MLWYRREDDDGARRTGEVRSSASTSTADDETVSSWTISSQPAGDTSVSLVSVSGLRSCRLRGSQVTVTCDKQSAKSAKRGDRAATVFHLPWTSFPRNPIYVQLTKRFAPWRYSTFPAYSIKNPNIRGETFGGRKTSRGELTKGDTSINVCHVHQQLNLPLPNGSTSRNASPKYEIQLRN